MRRGIRAAWDTFMFHAIIKSRGLVPAHDSFIARRVTGPGLASNYFYQVCACIVLVYTSASSQC